MDETEYIVLQRPEVASYCRRCGAEVHPLTLALHTWNHRRLAGERNLPPRPGIGC